MPSFVEQEFSWSQIVQWHILSPIAYFTFFALPVMFTGLLVDIRFKRWALTWYVQGADIRRIFWAIQGVLLAVLLLVAVPIGNRLFFPWIFREWSWPVLLGMMFGFLAAVSGCVAFVRAHRRLTGRCSACGSQISGAFALGKSCPQCGVVQHSWLLAPY